MVILSGFGVQFRCVVLVCNFGVWFGGQCCCVVFVNGPGAWLWVHCIGVRSCRVILMCDFGA